MIKKHTNKGFTIIEMIIYIALFSIIMSGAVVSVYSIISSTSRNQAKSMVAEEGIFLLAKIEWAATNAALFTTEPEGKDLIISKKSLPLIKFYLESTNLFMKEGLTTPEILNNSNTNITCPSSGCFIYNGNNDGELHPPFLDVQLILNSRTYEGKTFSEHFSKVIYLKQ